MPDNRATLQFLVTNLWKMLQYLFCFYYMNYSWHDWPKITSVTRFIEKNQLNHDRCPNHIHKYQIYHPVTGRSYLISEYDFRTPLYMSMSWIGHTRDLLKITISDDKSGVLQYHNDLVLCHTKKVQWSVILNRCSTMSC